MIVFRLLVALFIFSVFSHAKAYDTVTQEVTKIYICRSPSNSSLTSNGASPEAACAGIVATFNTVSVGNTYRTVKSASMGTCGPSSCFFTLQTTEYFVPSGTLAAQTTVQMSASFSGPQNITQCPEGSTETGKGGSSACSCNAGFMPNNAHTKCQQYTCPPSGSYSAITQPDQKVSNAGDGVCSGGCSQKPSSWKVGQDGQIWATWPFKSTGSFCQGDPKPEGGSSGESNTSNPAPVPCGLNQCPGTVNGAAVCVPCKGQSAEGSSTSASAPSGAASGAGSSTTNTSTTCNGVSCTTTTVTKDGTGAITGSVEKSEPQANFCKDNPQSPLCKPSSFSGSCSAVACEGDAVACAIAADQYKRNCQWFDDPEAAQLATIGNGAMSSNLRPDGHPANSVSSQSVNFATAIDQTDRLGGGCPSDLSVSVAGKSVAIPFSQMCGNLQLVGNLMVGFCMFAAALIVFRS